MLKDSDFWNKTGVHINASIPSPAYIFDLNVLKCTLEQIKNSLSTSTKICYAMKANPFLVKYLNEYVDRFEVCSPGEYEICNKNNIDPKKIIVSGVNKTYSSINRIMDLCKGEGIFTIESMQHYEILSKIAAERNLKIKLLIRLTSGNQFGVCESTIKEIFKTNKTNKNCDIIGIHYFSGTQKKLKKIEKEISQLDEFAKSLKEEYNISYLELEYGPGLMVDYFGDEKILSPDAQLKELNLYVKNIKNYNSICIEMGRFMVADCGCFLTQVEDIKTNPDNNFVILDSGLHQINYFGQMMGMKIPPIKQEQKAEENDSFEYVLCGSLCTTNDVLVRDIKLRKLSIGDRLLFQKCGAYSMTECIALFLSRDIPSIYLYTLKRKYECLRSSFETFKLNTKY